MDEKKKIRDSEKNVSFLKKSSNSILNKIFPSVSKKNKQTAQQRNLSVHRINQSKYSIKFVFMNIILSLEITVNVDPVEQSQSEVN